MKRTLSIIAILFSLTSAFGQKKDKNVELGPIPRVDGRVEISEVVTLDSTYQKAHLYKRAKLYFVDSYKSANDVIQYDDKEEGRIVGKGYFAIADRTTYLMTSIFQEWDVYYSTEIFCKDGRYRYRFYDVIIKQKYTVGGGVPSYIDFDLNGATEDKNWGPLKNMVFRMINSTVSKLYDQGLYLKGYMANGSVKSSDDF